MLSSNLQLIRQSRSLFLAEKCGVKALDHGPNSWPDLMKASMTPEPHSTRATSYVQDTRPTLVNATRPYYKVYPQTNKKKSNKLVQRPKKSSGCLSPHQ